MCFFPLLDAHTLKRKLTPFSLTCKENHLQQWYYGSVFHLLGALCVLYMRDDSTEEREFRKKKRIFTLLQRPL